jgi:NADPH:quinone reductase-like Zn-dependent oxidoreductase
MKAIVYTQYGPPDVLHLEEVPRPTPKDDEVLIKIHASSINAAEVHIVRGDPFLVRLMTGGVFAPKHTIPGADVAGVVAAVGSKVTQFKVGDEVYGDLSESGWGAFAEYACARQKAFVLKPANISFEAAAAVPLAGNTALQGLRDKGQLKAGQKVLINGAASGVGSFAVQIAKAFGAEVTAVGSGKKMDMIRSLGADHVIDYTREDILQTNRRYDLILDIAAFRPFADYAKIMTPTGVYVVAGGAINHLFRVMLRGPFASKKGGKQFTNLMAALKNSDLVYMSGLLASNKVIPVIDRCFPLSETAAALRYVEDRHVKGKVVITMGS